MAKATMKAYKIADEVETIAVSITITELGLNFATKRMEHIKLLMTDTEFGDLWKESARGIIRELVRDRMVSDDVAADVLTIIENK